MVGIWDFLFLIGALKIFYLSLEWAYSRLFLRINISNYSHGWVLITGASDGIGKSIASLLAHRGFKLILISRTQSKLSALVETLKSSSKNQNIVYITADFSTSHISPSFFSTLQKSLSSYNISVLINNVGTCEYKFFASQSLPSIENMLSVNLYPVTFLTYYLVPSFLKNFQENKQKSLIINFSSSADLVNIPTAAVYSATKTYIDVLSEGIKKEYYGKIDIATVKPGIVATNMSSVEVGNGMEVLPLTIQTDEYARYLVDHLYAGVNYGHWKHDVQALMFRLIPHQLINNLILVSVPIFEKLGLIHR